MGSCQVVVASDRSVDGIGDAIHQFLESRGGYVHADKPVAASWGAISNHSDWGRDGMWVGGEGHTQVNA